MAYTQTKEGNIVINSWQKGIADSPYNGIGDLKCANITTIPGEVSVNYARVRQSYASVSGTISMGIGIAISQTSGTAMTEGMGVVVTNSTITGLPSGTYTVVNTGSSYNFYDSLYTGIRTATGAGTATITSIDMGELIQFAIEKVSPILYNYYVLDISGHVWVKNSTNPLWYLLQPTGYNFTTTDPKVAAIAVYKGYLFMWAETVGAVPHIYYKSTASSSSLGVDWVDWKTLTTGANNPHYAITSNDGSVYFCNGNNIGEFFEVAGSTFNPATPATYTYIEKALYIGTTEIATRLTEMTNNDLIIGCISNSLYTWDKITTLAPFPMLLPEANTVELLTVNNIVYIFCGNKGNIYLTNGSNITNVLTIPDYITGQVEPFYLWHSAMYLRGRIWCSIEAPNCGGIWSFIPTTSYYVQQSNAGSSLRLEAKNSYNAYTGGATILFAPKEINSQAVRGAQYWAGWESDDTGSATHGIDFSSTIPYTGGQTIIETDIIPIGTFLNKKTFQQVEFKLATPLVAGESIEVQQRAHITDNFASIGINSTAGTLSDNFPVNFQTGQWLQLKIILTSTATNPSFVRLTEVRII